jgi:hypothetical protein
MRHALVTVHLIHEARSAAATEAAGRQLADAAPETPAPLDARPRRLATLFRRIRARALGFGAGSAGGGA